MKKALLAAITMMMMLSFNVKADPASTWFLVGAGFGYMANEKYEACNNKPFRTVQWAEGSNYTFKVSECDFQKNKDNYK